MLQPLHPRHIVLFACVWTWTSCSEEKRASAPPVETSPASPAAAPSGGAGSTNGPETAMPGSGGSNGGSPSPETGGVPNNGGAPATGGTPPAPPTTGGTGAGGEPGAGGAAEGGAGGDANAPSLPPDVEFTAYWPDMEGGGGTVFVTPGGEVFVSDTGNSPEHGRRILAILKDEIKTDQIDYLITTHYDPDHTRGFDTVVSGIEVKNFVDTGGQGMGQTPRIIAKPGEKLTIAGADFTFLAAFGDTLTEPLGPTEDNPHCGDRETGFQSPRGDQISLGYVITAGDFEFVEVGDLTWDGLDALVCPTNVLGREVDAVQVARHGQTGSSIRQWVNTLNPSVAVMNNAFQKGADEPSMAALQTVPGLGPDLSGLWQVHRHSVRGDSEQAPVDQAANTEADHDAHFIRLVAKGSVITVTNSRNGFEKTYPVK